MTRKFVTTCHLITSGTAGDRIRTGDVQLGKRNRNNLPKPTEVHSRAEVSDETPDSQGVASYRVFSHAKAVVVRQNRSTKPVVLGHFA
jgi:hypothetical protein